MFIINLTYIKSLEEVDAHLAAHVDFLKSGYDKGYFIASGRKAPRTGGVILSNLNDRVLLEDFVAHDPFKIAEVATYEIIEFTPSMTANGYDVLKGTDEKSR